VKGAPLQIKPNEMVWGDNAKETRDNILAMYKVPGLVVGLTEGLSGDNMKWAMIQFYDMALNPLAHMMGQALSEKLCPLYDEQLRCWYEEFTPNYPEHREATIKTDLVACAITPNEIRVMRGREPLPYAWADEPVRPVNMEQAGHPLGGEHTNPQDKPTKPKPQQPGTSDES